MIRLTVARYYTPTGRCIQKPYEQGKAEDYARDLINRYNHGELTSADSIHFPDSLKYGTLETHRTVYGGGGIMPDVFIPVDTTRYTDYHRKLVATGLINRAAMNYIDRHREELKKEYKRFAKYEEQFETGDEILSDLRSLADTEKIPFDESQYTRSLPLIRLQLKALIARDLFDMTEYFQIINTANDSYVEALRILNDPARYARILGQTQPTKDKSDS